MATPSEKSPHIESFLEKKFGRTSAITADVCVMCGSDASEFRDALSRKEYSVSGMCQNCQDAVFGTGDE